MVELSPLVLINGQVQELLSGDTISGSGTEINLIITEEEGANSFIQSDNLFV